MRRHGKFVSNRISAQSPSRFCERATREIPSLHCASERASHGTDGIITPRDMEDEAPPGGAIAFALIYLTFFLDNVLLTVLVPIIPDWVRGEALELWRAQEAPLAALLNGTAVTREAGQGGGGGGGGGGGAAGAAVGMVLGAKAGAQLVVAPLAAGAVCRRGPAAVLRAATAVLTLAALVFAWCSTWGGRGAAWGAGVGRAAQGAGAALGGVAGLALCAAAVPHAQRRANALGALLGAVALGVLVGYPFGGAANAMWSRETPFLLIAGALLANLAMQYMFLGHEAFNRVSRQHDGSSGGWRAAAAEARVGAAGACAGAVLLTASVMAALEPCLPLWLMDKFHPQRWTFGAVFVPDSAGYLVAASSLGGAARRLGAERLALGGQLAVGLAALAVPLATSVRALTLPHIVLGCGLGATDAALVPALLARRPRHVPQVAALLQAASSAAAGLGPVVGGVVAWGVGFEALLRALGVLNLLYAAFLYRALAREPLSEQWGAATPEDESDSDGGAGGDAGGEAGEAGEASPLAAPAPGPAHPPSRTLCKAMH